MAKKIKLKHLKPVRIHKPPHHVAHHKKHHGNHHNDNNDNANDGSQLPSTTDENSGVYSPTLGNSYPYAKYIRPPNELGISGKGDLNALSKDITGLVAYTEVLVRGTSKASKSGQPLGNKFFLPTNTSCYDKDTNDKVDRHIYFSNVPSGHIPFLPESVGGDVKSLRGLIPGLISNVYNIHIPGPSDIFQSFASGAGGSKCQNVTLEVIDINNNKAMESKYVAVTDIAKMDPCLFPDHKNPVTKIPCLELFKNLNPHISNNKMSHENDRIYRIPDDVVVQLYFLCFGVLLMYVLLKIVFLKNNRRL